MKKIVALYIRLLKDFNIRSIDAFVERFYQRMAKDRFESILRNYGIAPVQHRESWVLQALQTKVSVRDETHTSQPSESSAISLVSTHEKISESITTPMSDGDIRSTRETISRLDEMIKTPGIKQGKLESLLERRNSLEMRIRNISNPESSDKGITSLEQDSQISFSN